MTFEFTPSANKGCPFNEIGSVAIVRVLAETVQYFETIVASGFYAKGLKSKIARFFDRLSLTPIDLLLTWMAFHTE